MVYSLVIAGTLICAFLAIQVKRLLYSALWLAGASALTALLLYMLGAPEIAVVELSVGAGLVTILFVFAINITGEELSQDNHPSAAAKNLVKGIPKSLIWIILVLIIGLLGWMNLPELNQLSPAISSPTTSMKIFTQMVWDIRSPDVILQIVLIFTGMLSVLGLLDEKDKHLHHGEEQ